MNISSQHALRHFQPKHDFFIGIDSDGCVFDSMELKHKECFIPAIIRHWKLQAISKYVREAAEFVNLYSKWRGTNRFPALIKVFDLLKERPEVMLRGVPVPEMPELRKFIDSGVALGNPELIKAIEKTHDPELQKALGWSEAINQAIAEMVEGIPPFPFVRESLEKLQSRADIMVVSATPGETLRREWHENDIAHYAAIIAGQEAGSKKEQLNLAASGKYRSNRVLMLGDAPGDLDAARQNHALFYPIKPGFEAESWEHFYNEASDNFFKENYTGAYQAKLIAEFEMLLTDIPPWKK
ncbi:HAD family hydrolase [candidate division KSB1 bacterium]|nr:HAD family hydrolase [candidate division KSB1 bacterium]